MWVRVASRPALRAAGQIDVDVTSIPGADSQQLLVRRWLRPGVAGVVSFGGRRVEHAGGAFSRRALDRFRVDTTASSRPTPARGRCWHPTPRRWRRDGGGQSETHRSRPVTLGANVCVCCTGLVGLGQAFSTMCWPEPQRNLTYGAVCHAPERMFDRCHGPTPELHTRATAAPRLQRTCITTALGRTQPPPPSPCPGGLTPAATGRIGRNGGTEGVLTSSTDGPDAAWDSKTQSHLELPPHHRARAVASAQVTANENAPVEDGRRNCRGLCDFCRPDSGATDGRDCSGNYLAGVPDAVAPATG